MPWDVYNPLMLVKVIFFSNVKVRNQIIEENHETHLKNLSEPAK